MLNKDRGSQRSGRIVGLLDIGSSKIVCLIAALNTGARSGALAGTRVIGLGHTRSRGIKAGVVTDLQQAEEAVRSAVDQAERMSGVRLEDVCVSVACGRLKSQTFAAHAEIDRGVVTTADIGRVMEAGRAFAERDGRSLVHMNRIGFRLDGQQSVQDPRGMTMRRLTADLHTVTADEAPVRNLIMLIERCHLGVSSLVVAPYASALATLSEEERRLGATVVDIGGGSMSIGYFADGQFIHADAIPVGANHITFDIARCLQTPLAEAERIKALYGTLVGAQSDEHEGFSYPLAGEDDGVLQRATKAQLTQIVRPRVSALLGQIAERIAASGWSEYAGGRVVLTGGGAQMVGMGEFAADVLQKPVRIARPAGISGLPQSVCSPAFSTLVGLLIARVLAEGELVTYKDREVLAQGYFGRVGQWLMDGL